MTQLRRLTDKGIQRFQSFIDSIPTDEPESFDPAVINDPTHSRTIDAEVSVQDTCPFSTRFEVAEYLEEIIAATGISDPEFDRGLWCWLSWVWFESLCPIEDDGTRKPKESARWILNPDWDRYYRHLLAGPWWIYRTHRDDPARAVALLCTSVTSPGELVGQIASRQELVSNPGLVAMLSRLYYDPLSKTLKRGHAGKGAGSARRMADVADQLDMVWDLYSTSADEFLELLPGEFDRFRS